MRINVFGIRGFPGVQGGVEKHCEGLYPRLASDNVDLKVFRRKPYLSKESEKTYKHIIFNDGWTIKNKFLETPIHSLLAAFKTIKDHPDVVHIHNIAAATTLPMLKLFGLKCVVTYHSANYEHSKWNWFAKLCLRTAEKIVFLFADRIIFVSDDKFNSTSIKKSKAVFIPNGVPDLSGLKPSIKLSKFGLKKSSYILSVGRIVPEKRFSDLIEAFSRIDSKMKLVIVGGYDNHAAYFKELMKYKPKLKDRLIFTGVMQSNDLKLLYENAFCFVLPSENEGMPIVLLEAMSLGIYPLVSDIKPNLRVVKDRGMSFRVKDIDDLKNKLEHLIRRPVMVRKQRSNIISSIKEECDWEKVAEKTLSVYKEALNEKKL